MEGEEIEAEVCCSLKFIFNFTHFQSPNHSRASVSLFGLFLAQSCSFLLKSYMMEFVVLRFYFHLCGFLHILQHLIFLTSALLCFLQ